MVSANGAVSGMNSIFDPIISPNIRIRRPELLTIGEGSIIDDYCYFSTEISIGRFCHIANGVTVGGGRSYRFSMGDYSGISSGVKIWCESNDYVNDLITLRPPGVDIGDSPICGNVSIGSMCGIGANTVIMPGNEIPEGTAIGALSFVPPYFKMKPWSIYAGNPVKLVWARNKERVLEQTAKLESAVGRETRGHL